MKNNLIEDKKRKWVRKSTVKSYRIYDDLVKKLERQSKKQKVSVNKIVNNLIESSSN